jgi:hypothetical protein
MSTQARLQVALDSSEQPRPDVFAGVNGHDGRAPCALHHDVRAALPELDAAERKEASEERFRGHGVP